MLGTSWIALGDVKDWLLTPTAGDTVVKLIWLCELPIKPAPANSPINWKSPKAYWPFIPKRGPAPVNNDVVV